MLSGIQKHPKTPESPDWLLQRPAVEIRETPPEASYLHLLGGSMQSPVGDRLAEIEETADMYCLWTKICGDVVCKMARSINFVALYPKPSMDQKD